MKWLSNCINRLYSSSCTNELATPASILPPMDIKELSPVVAINCQSCIKPCAQHPAVPTHLNIDQSKPLHNTVPPYAIHIIIMTGQTDWPAHIEDDGLAQSLISAIRKRKHLDHRSFETRYHPAYFGATTAADEEKNQRVIVTNSSLPSTYSTMSRAQDIILLPDSIIISNVTAKRVDGLLDYVFGKPSNAAKCVEASGGERRRRNNDAGGVGHAFAGNLVVYTHNGHRAIWYGRVTPCYCKDIVENTLDDDKVIEDLVREHFGPGGVFAIPTLKPSNATKNCFECGTSFSLFKQKYHCRNCGNVVCNSCSDHRHALKKFGYENPVRCCITCDKLINMQNMTSNELSKLPPKTLKEYIHAYNLPFKSAIEKSDLVRIIFNTRPISNQSETYYRKHRTKQPSHNEEGGGNSFSFTNIVQDIFSPPPVPTSSNRQEQARQHEEHSRRQREEQLEQARRQREEQEAQARRQREEREQQARRQREEQQRRQHAQSTSPTPSSHASPPPTRPTSQPQLSNDNLLSLHDLIKNKIDPASLSVRTLKSILKANYVKQSHVIEKSELVKLVVRLADQHRAEMESSKRNDEDESGGNEDLLCRVCFDRQQNCVFLDCGHMATCIECAKKLIETRNECPICREPILKLVHVVIVVNKI
ncbi:hypothetical protein HPULCUR_005415 [Helicostylum pulchrum]|uniref:RING-type domain-containing protein n=1 Tax=Helicostylum pulchrum TaxID=562976 RepID=A0ABP9XYZ9_9FUNG